jgi:hypothetical protein
MTAAGHLAPLLRTSVPSVLHVLPLLANNQKVGFVQHGLTLIFTTISQVQCHKTFRDHSTIMQLIKTASAWTEARKWLHLHVPLRLPNPFLRKLRHPYNFLQRIILTIFNGEVQITAPLAVRLLYFCATSTSQGSNRRHNSLFANLSQSPIMRGASFKKFQNSFQVQGSDFSYPSPKQI